MSEPDHPELISLPVTPSANPDEARLLLLDDLGDWIGDCLRDYDALAPTDVHDQATYTTSWATYIEATGDDRPLRFMLSLRDQIRDHFTQSGAWRHGYWRRAEVHHGTEHFTLFLATLRRQCPADPETAHQILDAAEHLGNWSPAVPDWLDWDIGLFRSLHLGTDFVGLEPGQRLNVADHFRCLDLALLAHEVSTDRVVRASRPPTTGYLDLARAHALRWAEAILNSDTLPAGLLPEGPIYGDLDAPADQAYRSFAGMAAPLADELGRAENLLASGAVEVLLRLWKLTGESLLRQAAERLLDAIAAHVAAPDAGPAADAIRTYRRATGDTRYDAAVLKAVADLGPPVAELTISPRVVRASRPPGIGTRTDMPEWLEDDQPRRRNPITLSVAAEIAGDAALAVQALDLAHAYFTLARRAYPHGRDHGCAANTVSAIARGHGRDNGAGMITAVLAPWSADFPGRVPG